MKDLTQPGTMRLVSLDVMRGLTMAAMILVNYPGSEHIYQPLEHAEWNGLTPTDLIFPFFLFIVGVSIAISYTRLREKESSRTALNKKIIFRAIKIFAVGLFLTLLPSFDFLNIRITGVLQRISIVFLVCSFIFLDTSVKTQIWMCAVTLLVYWLALTLIPTPGIGHVALERGVNLAAWVDSKLLPGRMWQGTWDPEGILSTFPSIVTGITGLLAGHLLIRNISKEHKVIMLMVVGFLGVTAGYVWGLIFPVNKNLWTSSYVLVTSGLASLFLGTLYFLIDIRGYKSWTTPAIIFGSNAIAIYFISDCISYIFYLIPFGSGPLNEMFVNGVTSAGAAPKFASLLYAMLFVSINFCIAWILYRKKIFIRL